MTPLQVVRAFWPSVGLRIDGADGPAGAWRLIIRDPACRRDVAAWIRAHGREIMEEMLAGGWPDVSRGEGPWKKGKAGIRRVRQEDDAGA